MQTIKKVYAVSSNVAVRGDSGPCSIGLLRSRRGYAALAGCCRMCSVLSDVQRKPPQVRFGRLLARLPLPPRRPHVRTWVHRIASRKTDKANNYACIGSGMWLRTMGKRVCKGSGEDGDSRKTGARGDQKQALHQKYD